MSKLIASLIVALVLPLGAQAAVVWRGDFETGDRSQWSNTQMVNADRLQVQSTRVAEGKYALKATVYQGDDPINSSGNRNELVRMTNEREGDDFYYRWSTYFPTDFPAPDTWQLFVQWHHSGSSGSPPVEFVVRDERIELSLKGGQTVPWAMPLKRGQWIEFILHVGWSSSTSKGFLELWVDGKKVLDRTPAATLFSGQTNYLKMGLYRNESISPVGVVYHDGMVQATRLEDVLPPPAPPAPVVTPAPAPTPVVTPSQPAPAPSPVVVPSQPAPAPSVDELPSQPAPAEPIAVSQPTAGASPVTSGGATLPTDTAAVVDAELPAQGCSAAGGSLGLLGLLLGLPALAARRRRQQR